MKRLHTPGNDELAAMSAELRKMERDHEAAARLLSAELGLTGSEIEARTLGQIADHLELHGNAYLSAAQGLRELLIGATSQEKGT